MERLNQGKKLCLGPLKLCLCKSMLRDTCNLVTGLLYPLLDPIILEVNTKIKEACRGKKMGKTYIGRHEWWILAASKLVKAV